MTFLRPLDGFPEKRARLMVEMHMIAPLHLTQLAIPGMRDRGRGWVLNLTSVGGDLPQGPPFVGFDRGAGFGMYGTVKAGAEPADQEPCRRTVRRRHRRQRRRAVQPSRHPGAGTLDLAKTDTEDIELITETALRALHRRPRRP